jgi:hypothetical protein
MRRAISKTIAAAIFMLLSSATPGQVVTITATPTAETKFFMFQLGRGGCHPATRNVPSGVVGIHLVNSSHHASLNMILHPEGGANMTSTTLSGTNFKWTQTVTLTAGTYILEASGNPALKCTIVAQ